MNKGIKGLDSARQRRRIISMRNSSSSDGEEPGHDQDSDDTNNKLQVKRGRGRPPKLQSRKGGRRIPSNQKSRARILAGDETPTPELGFIELPKKRGRPRKQGNEFVYKDDSGKEEGLYDNVGKRRRRLGRVTDQST